MLKRAKKQVDVQAEEQKEGAPVKDTGVSVSEDEKQMSAEEMRQNELERLRDILYGSQSRAIEQRIADLEARSAKENQETQDTLFERLEALNTSFNKQIADLRTELKDLIGQESAQQNTAVQSVQRELSERLDLQQKENTENLQVVQRSLSERLDNLASDTNRQMQGIQRDLSERLNQVNSEQTERARNNQIEARQRVDNLRAELTQINGLLSGQKISRDELGVLLLELSHRLQKE